MVATAGKRSGRNTDRAKRLARPADSMRRRANPANLGLERGRSAGWRAEMPAGRRRRPADALDSRPGGASAHCACRDIPISQSKPRLKAATSPSAVAAFFYAWRGLTAPSFKPLVNLRIVGSRHSTCAVVHARCCCASTRAFDHGPVCIRCRIVVGETAGRCRAATRFLPRLGFGAPTRCVRLVAEITHDRRAVPDGWPRAESAP